MRVLLSTIGSRGDVQPLVALALELKERGDDVRLCVPPDFREWIEGMGLAVTAIGREVRAGAAALPTRPSPELMRQLAEETVAAQFATLGEAARDRDVVVGATALQIAAPSVAEHLGIPYVFVALCPAVLPSPLHAPIVMALRGRTVLRSASRRSPRCGAMSSPIVPGWRAILRWGRGRTPHSPSSSRARGS